MSTSQLALYNGALLLLASRKLATLTDNVDTRFKLDDAWAAGDIRNRWLQSGFWKFALRSVKLDSNPAIVPAFGYRYAFNLPDDFVKTASFCSDENFNCPITRYAEENGVWTSDIDPVYVRYVSNDSSFGLDMSKWTEYFTQWCKADLALEIAPSVTTSETVIARVEKKWKTRLIDAQSKDALEGPTQFMPNGSWVRSRMGRSSRDRVGSTLYG